MVRSLKRLEDEGASVPGEAGENESEPSNCWVGAVRQSCAVSVALRPLAPLSKTPRRVTRMGERTSKSMPRLPL